MSATQLQTVEVGPGEAASGSVIWLHGLGANGHDFEPIVPYLGVPADVRFVFPHAPARPVTINMGMTMPAWYDIREMDLRREHDEAGVRESAAQVTALIEREVSRGVPTTKIVLAGFSQGGAIALHLGVRYPERLAGIMALSTYLVCEETVEAERSDANHDTPILQIHGALDPMVRVDRGEAARDRLKALGYPLEWRTFEMAHEVTHEEIRVIGAWLNARLGTTA